MNKIKELWIPRNTRVIVISDIHGELELFKDLLKKAALSPEDYLIINGDLCEKGSNSHGVVHYIMELSATNPNVHVTEGNCDTLVEDLVEENPKLLNYLRTRTRSIIHEWLDQIGFELNEDTKIEEVKQCLMGPYSEEINWLMGLPTAIETNDYIFVHAGLEDVEDWKETDRIKAITYRSFLDHAHTADKYVIVGHWPVVNYSSEIPSHNPIIDETRKIIAIDGGNVIKKTGQLNALIIDRTTDKDTFSYKYTDHFPECEVLEDFHADPVLTGSISYPSYELVPIRKDEHFTLCEQVETIHRLYVKNEYIKQNENGQTHAKNDLSCAQINVQKEDIVSLVDDSCSGFDLIKKDGVEGWIVKGILQKVDQQVTGKVHTKVTSYV
ncbi:metallophosphoesterase [Rossellomorea oryzaecorticis]|uniref:Metallophosphoesterase n=1 Tax=Rossellomorea oryzaecorticis TaxID=1396505 RepID=A0ABU9K875_9BACI